MKECFLSDVGAADQQSVGHLTLDYFDHRLATALWLTASLQQYERFSSALRSIYLKCTDVTEMMMLMVFIFLNASFFLCQRVEMRLLECDHLPDCVTSSGRGLNCRSACSQINLQTRQRRLDWADILRGHSQTLKYTTGIGQLWFHSLCETLERKKIHPKNTWHRYS